MCPVPVGLSLPSRGCGERCQAFDDKFTEWPLRHALFRVSPWLSLGRSWGARKAVGEATGQSSYHFFANGAMDLALYEYFFAHPKPLRGGTYIEIGAQNGVWASNTLFFEQTLDWRGVLIEPTACGRCMLPWVRPHDLTLNAAVCNAPRWHNVTLTTFCPIKQSYCGFGSSGVYKAYEVPCLPMTTLLRGAPHRVDFMTIDVEEHYMSVLETMPWDTIAIDVLVVECLPKQRVKDLCMPFLAARGYVFPKVYQRPFGDDLLAVRRDCVQGPLDEH